MKRLFISMDEALREYPNVEKMFNGSIAVKNGLVRDVDLNGWFKDKHYHLPEPVLNAFQKIGGDNININNIILTILENFERGGKRYRDLLKQWEENRRFDCGTLRHLFCERCNVEYVFRVPCKKEWCRSCGVPGSLYHIERYFKTLFYGFVMFMYAGAEGYWVITTPPEKREALKKREGLSGMVSEVGKIFKGEGFAFGHWVWHFAGDQSERYYPHLNVLIPSGFIDEAKMERIKAKIRDALDIKVVYYEYALEIPRIKFISWYVSRPTFLQQNEVSPEEFKGLHKSGIWGRKYFQKDDEIMKMFYEVMFSRGVESVKNALESGKEEVEVEIEDEDLFYVSLHSGRCPICGGKLKGGPFRGYEDRIVKGDVFRMGWNLWLYLRNKRKIKGGEYGE
jgi:hypothetical protein